MSLTRFFDVAIWLAGIGHFALLGASSQVPKQLNWSTELPKLSAFNRKLFWTYGGYIVGTYLAFAILTLVLHDELLRGDKSALALAVFIGLYWLARLIVDATYYSHKDWPAGRKFVLGHIALDLLFGYFTVVYLGLVVWHAVN
jgi:hypothetical protein